MPERIHSRPERIRPPQKAGQKADCRGLPFAALSRSPACTGSGIDGLIATRELADILPLLSQLKENTARRRFRRSLNERIFSFWPAWLRNSAGAAAI